MRDTSFRAILFTVMKFRFILHGGPFHLLRKTRLSQALALADELRGRGFSVWIDQSGIGGAQTGPAEIVEGINGCSTFIVLISPDSVASRNVAKEVHLAFEKRKKYSSRCHREGRAAH